MAQQDNKDDKPRGGATGAPNTEKSGSSYTPATGRQEAAPTGSIDFDQSEGFDRSEGDSGGGNPGSVDTTGGGITTGGTQ